MECDLPCITGKDDIYFSRRYDLTPLEENERWYFSKNTWKNHILFRYSEKIVFSKKWTEIWSFLYERWYFLAKRWSFFFERKLKDDLSEEIHGKMILSYVRTGATSMILCLSPKRNQRWSSPAKMHLRTIDILDWYSRNSANNPLYFYRDPYRRFHILLSSEEDPGNLIYRIEVWLLYQFIRLEIFYYEESLILCTIQPSDFVFGGVLGCQPRKLSDH